MIAANGPINERLDLYRAMFRLDGKTALILGAASGIRKASAEANAHGGREIETLSRRRGNLQPIIVVTIQPRI